MKSADSRAKSALEVLGMPFAGNPHPMWIYDLQTLAFLKVNEAAIRVYGFSEREFRGMTLLDVRPSKDVERFLHSWNHPYESTKEKWWHIGRSGTPFPVLITSWRLSFEGHDAELVLARRDVEVDSGPDPGRTLYEADGERVPDQSRNSLTATMNGKDL